VDSGLIGATMLAVVLIGSAPASRTNGNDLRHRMKLIEAIRESWGWAGIEPVEVVGENDFGNLIIKDEAGQYWRLRPEECNCEVIAQNRSELDALSRDQAFLHEWYMTELVSMAKERFGSLSEGRKYCFKCPTVLGGAYGADSMATAPLVNLVNLSGDIARQIKDVPDGAQVRARVVE